MQIQCRMCPDAASAEDTMTAMDRHIKSITVFMSANFGIVAYDIILQIQAGN